MAFARAAAPADQKRIIGRGFGVFGNFSGRGQRKGVFVVKNESGKRVFTSGFARGAVRAGIRAAGHGGFHNLRQGGGALIYYLRSRACAQFFKVVVEGLFKGGALVAAEPCREIHVRKNHPQSVLFLAQCKAVQPGGFPRDGLMLRQYVPQLVFQHSSMFSARTGRALWIKA